VIFKRQSEKHSLKPKLIELQVLNGAWQEKLHQLTIAGLQKIVYGTKALE
jgi:hypothetical protein